jgi:hypothetical protein
METAVAFVFCILLILVGGEIAGNIYFAIVSRQWQSYFKTNHMDDDSQWAYLIFIFLCYSAVVSILNFIKLVFALGGRLIFSNSLNSLWTWSFWSFRSLE